MLRSAALHGFLMCMNFFVIQWFLIRRKKHAIRLIYRMRVFFILSFADMCSPIPDAILFWPSDSGRPRVSWGAGSKCKKSQLKHIVECGRTNCSKDLEYDDINMNYQWQGDTMRYLQRMAKVHDKGCSGSWQFAWLSSLCLQTSDHFKSSRLPPTVRLVCACFAKVPMFETFDDELIARITDIVAPCQQGILRHQPKPIQTIIMSNIDDI